MFFQKGVSTWAIYQERSFYINPQVFIKRGIFTSSIFSRGPVCQGSDDVTQAGQGLVNGGTLLQAVSSGSRAVSSLTEIASMPTFIQWIPQVDFIYEIQKKKKAKVDPTFSILFICIQKLQNNWHLVSLAAEFINVTYFNFEKLNFQILIDLLENRSFLLKSGPICYICNNLKSSFFCIIFNIIYAFIICRTCQPNLQG